MLRIESLSVDRYDPVSGDRSWVLQDVNLSLSPGESAAIIGPNGAGKSTLLLAIAGALPIVKGTVSVGDVTLRRGFKARRALRERLGVALQFPERGFFGQTVREEITFTCERLGWTRQQCEEAGMEALQRVGLSTGLLHRSLYGLSGGEKRLVALAAAIAHRPQCLLLDEPEVGLDLLRTRQVGDFLRRFTKDGGIVCAVTHDVEGAFYWAKRFFLLKDGQLQGEVLEDELRSWLWDQGVFGRVHQGLREKGRVLPSPYGQPREFVEHIRKEMEQRR